jgi:hypothetical protein
MQKTQKKFDSGKRDRRYKYFSPQFSLNMKIGLFEILKH